MIAGRPGTIDSRTIGAKRTFPPERLGSQCLERARPMRKSFAVGYPSVTGVSGFINSPTEIWQISLLSAPVTGQRHPTGQSCALYLAHPYNWWRRCYALVTPRI